MLQSQIYKNWSALNVCAATRLLLPLFYLAASSCKCVASVFKLRASLIHFILCQSFEHYISQD